MPVNELIAGESARVTGSIENAITGVAFEPTTLEFTLYDRASETIINSRDAVSLTPGTVAPGGALAHSLLAADVALVDSEAEVETHVIRYKWTYNAGADVGIAEIAFNVRRDRTP
jgi:hypothetical protein